jgi:hypothetical protein
MSLGRLWRGAVVFTILFSLAGCATLEPTTRHIALNSWSGRNYQDVIYQLGRPAGIYIDGLGGRVLVYPLVETSSTAGIHVPQDSLRAYEAIVWDYHFNQLVPSHVERTHDLLFLNRYGVIYSFQSNESDYISRVSYENAALVGGIVGGIILFGLLVISAGNDY